MARNIVITNPALKLLSQSKLSNLLALDVNVSYVDVCLSPESLKTAHGILCTCDTKIGNSIIKAAENLKVISTCSVGYNHIDLKACGDHNVKVGYTPGVFDDVVAELAMTLLLACSRNMVAAMAGVKDGTWFQWNEYAFLSKGLQNSVIGIVGLGAIGKAVANRLKPFKPLRVVYCGPHKKPEALEKELNCSYVTFDELIKDCDFVIICCILNDSTKHIFKKDTFKQMKKTSVIVNVARGEVIQQEDLVDALRSGTIAFAALDVTTPEPLPLDSDLLNLCPGKCIIVPHIGGSTFLASEIAIDLAVKNLICGVNDEKMPAELKIC